MLEIEYKGIKYTIEIKNDFENSDISFLGTFTDEDDFPITFKRNKPCIRELKYFKPRITFSERLQKDLPPDEAYTKAIDEIYDDIYRAETFGDKWWWTGIIIRKNDEEVDSIWGIESDIKEKDLIELARSYLP